jgi:hypothetical protein
MGASGPSGLSLQLSFQQAIVIASTATNFGPITPANPRFVSGKNHGSSIPIRIVEVIKAPYDTAILKS